MIEQQNRQVSSLKMQWSTQEIQKLNTIYREEVSKGKKKLWKRIQSRINQKVRVASRQAIEYKWKNYCACPDIASNKICKNQQLIEQLFMDIAYRGYYQLTKCQNYKNMQGPPPFRTQSNMKNTFYSNIRSICKFILKNISPQQPYPHTLKMLSNRHFLRIMQQNGLSIIQLRRSINILKSIIKSRRQSKCEDRDLQQIEEIQQSLREYLGKIQELYCQFEKTGCKKRGLIVNCQRDQQNGGYSLSEQNKAGKDEQQITSLQRQSQQKNYLSVQSINQHMSGLISMKSFTSFNFLVNDF